jgi:heme exporter protein C
MRSKPLTLRILDVLSVLLLLAATYMALAVAPEEAVMGQVQRIFYFHIGTAWTGLLGFLFAAGLGITYLIRHDRKWDIAEAAAVEISAVFFFITIVLGSIWARPIWNTWWTWEPRLTTAAITELIYVAYFMLREGIEDPDRRARFGAVYTLVGSLSVPVTYFSTLLLRSIHPVLFVGSNPNAAASPALTPPMLPTFFFGLFTFTVIFADLFWNRIRMGQLAAQVEQLKLDVVQ